MYDVVVAGGGPAGSAAALHLARAGLRVCLIERAAFPRPKPCGEYLSPATVDALRGLNADVPGLDASPVTRIRLHNAGRCATLQFRRPGASLPRAALDDALFHAAQAAGVTAIRARAEETVHAHGARSVTLRMPDGSREAVEARAVIAADGARSMLARSAGLTAPPAPNARFAIGGHYTLAADSGAIEMFVGGAQYFAVNPLGAGAANAMLIAPESAFLAHRLDPGAFFRERAAALSAGKYAPDEAALQGKRVAFGPLEHRALRYTAPGLYLIGDAAHFLDPFTGQGICLALHGARIAAEAIVSVVSGAVPEAEARARFERRLGAEIRRRSAFARAGSALVRMPQLAPAAQLFAPLMRAIAE